MLSSMQNKRSKAVKVDRLPARKVASPIDKYVIGPRKKNEGTLLVSLDSESTMQEADEEPDLPRTPPRASKSKASPIDLDTPPTPPPIVAPSRQRRLPVLEAEDEIDELASDYEDPDAPQAPIAQPVPAKQTETQTAVESTESMQVDEEEADLNSAEDFLNWLEHNVKIEG
jgi:hypothetical protein